MDFSQGAGAESPSSTIPKGQLAWVIINFRALKPSQSGGQYLDLELTIDDGQPYARKKLWEMIGDPLHQGNSEAYRNMGFIAITRILECGNNAGPHNPAGYQVNDYSALNGMRVAVKIGVDAGTDGYADKNRVAEWLTPNPESKSGNKDFVKLMNGEFNTNPQQAQNQPSTQASFGFPAGQAPQAGAPQQGFQQPAGEQQQAQQPSAPATPAGSWGTGQQPTQSAAPASTTKSPSDINAAPGWMTQG